LATYPDVVLVPEIIKQKRALRTFVLTQLNELNAKHIWSHTAIVETFGRTDNAFDERVGVGYMIKQGMRTQILGLSERHILEILPEITMMIMGRCVDSLDSTRRK